MRFRSTSQYTRVFFFHASQCNFFCVNRTALFLFLLLRQAVAISSYLLVCLEATPQCANFFALLTYCVVTYVKSIFALKCQNTHFRETINEYTIYIQEQAIITARLSCFSFELQNLHMERLQFENYLRSIPV